MARGLYYSWGEKILWITQLLTIDLTLCRQWTNYNNNTIYQEIVYMPTPNKTRLIDWMPLIARLNIQWTLLAPLLFFHTTIIVREFASMVFLWMPSTRSLFTLPSNRHSSNNHNLLSQLYSFDAGRFMNHKSSNAEQLNSANNWAMGTKAEREREGERVTCNISSQNCVQRTIRIRIKSIKPHFASTSSAENTHTNTFISSTCRSEENTKLLHWQGISQPANNKQSDGNYSRRLPCNLPWKSHHNIFVLIAYIWFYSPKSIVCVCVCAWNGHRTLKNEQHANISVSPEGTYKGSAAHVYRNRCACVCIPLYLLV